MSDSPDPARTLADWHEAVNAGDVEAAVACCAEDVAVQGPRGVGHGHDLVRGWLTRSGIRLEPQEELVEGDGRFVVREVARWTTANAPGGAPLEPTETWCMFTVADGKVTSIARFETLGDIPPV
ncbi:MAG: nuclear transport factor 2 family protein [Nocardioidaceae bacterium]